MVTYVNKFKIHRNLIRLLNISYVNTTGYVCLCWYQYRWSTTWFPSVKIIKLRIYNVYLLDQLFKKFLYFGSDNLMFRYFSYFDHIFSVSFWFVQKFLATKISHEDGVRNIQRQVLEWRKSGMKKKMCTARPSWKSISLQNLTYKDSSYKV